MVFLLLLVLMSMGTPLFATTVLMKSGGEDTSSGMRDITGWSPLTVAQCRAVCLQEFTGRVSTYATCMLATDCISCWQTCDVLQSSWLVWGSICSEKAICPAGCRAACHFLATLCNKARGPQLVLETRASAELETRGLTLQWPCFRELPEIYVVLWRPRGKDQWQQLTQTADCWAEMPTAGAARVLVVGPSGLEAVYSPAPAVAGTGATPTEHAEGDDGAEGGGWKTRTVNGSQWSLRLASVIHQGALVIAELSWRLPEKDLKSARGIGGSPLYLVTWEVDGGGITGNLYTDSSCVTLSLSSHTVFHIQVVLVTKADAAPVRSPVLLVDTGGDEGGNPLVMVASEGRAGRRRAALRRWHEALRLTAWTVVGLCVAAGLLFCGAWFHYFRRRRMIVYACDKQPLF